MPVRLSGALSGVIVAAVVVPQALARPDSGAQPSSFEGRPKVSLQASLGADFGRSHDRWRQRTVSAFTAVEVLPPASRSYSIRVVPKPKGRFMIVEVDPWPHANR